MPLDRHERPLRSLRISVTDRCNLRCRYCMPEEEYTWLERADLLSFEELVRVAAAFAGLGARRVRLTGGEPLLRRDLVELVRQLKAIPELEEVALTTNGVRLSQHAAALKAAGLSRVTVSLDSLDRERFEHLTRRDDLLAVRAGIAAARAAGLPVKLNTVALRGVNDGELGDVVDYAREVGAEARFIEYMDVGGATRWSEPQVMSRERILARLTERYGEPEALAATSAPARRYRFPDGTVVGVIASTTAPFCGSCDRARVTADGQLFLCLYARQGIDLRSPLRAGASQDELAARVSAAWEGREDRGAEERLRLSGRRIPLAAPAELREQPHLEMHTRGG